MKTPHAVLVGLAVLATCVSVAAAGPGATQQVTISVKGRGVAGDATGTDRKSTRLNSSHIQKSRMPSSA